MVENTIRMVDMNVSYKAVHASRGKVVRAEPVAALYEQGRIHHIGAFPTLKTRCADSPRILIARLRDSHQTESTALSGHFPNSWSRGSRSQGMFDLARRQSEALAAKTRT